MNDLRTDITDKESFVKAINILRRSSGWYTYAGSVEGLGIGLKGYGTWLQIFIVNGVSYGGCLDLSVKGFNKELLEPFGGK